MLSMVAGVRKHPVKICLSGLLISILWTILWPSPVFSQDGAVVEFEAEVVVDQTVFVEVEISGYTIPYSHVMVKEGGGLVIENRLDDDGYFYFRFSIAKNRSSSLDISAEAVGGTTEPLRIVVDPASYDRGATTELVLPPILKVAAPIVVKGDELSFYGFGPRAADIEIYPSFAGGSHVARSDASGYFEYKMDTASIDSGRHTAQATATLFGVESIQGNSVEFSVSPSGALNTFLAIMNWFLSLGMEMKVAICFIPILAFGSLFFLLWFRKNYREVVVRVYDGSTRQFLPGFDIKVTKDENAGFCIQGKGNKKGRVSFLVRLGRYDLSVSAEGYSLRTVEIYAGRGGKQVIEVEIVLYPD